LASVNFIFVNDFPSRTALRLPENRRYLRSGIGGRQDDLRRVGTKRDRLAETGMAMPVLSKSGYPAGSLNVAMLSVRYSPKVRDLIAETLEAAARGLSGLSA
jgi:hypothetical protein